MSLRMRRKKQVGKERLAMRKEIKGGRMERMERMIKKGKEKETL